mgnify:CR=1 FL=1
MTYEPKHDFSAYAGREADQDYDLMAREAEAEAKLWGGVPMTPVTNTCLDCGAHSKGIMLHNDGCRNYRGR